MRINHGLRAAATGGGGVTTDPNFRNTVLLLNGDGTNGAQNNTFIDSSTNNFTITRNGNVTQGSFSPYGDRWSAFFDGTGDYLSIPDSNTWAFAGDFTVEAWVYPTSLGAERIIISQWFGGTTANTAFTIDFQSTNKVRAIFSSGGTMATINSSSTYTANAWYHISAVRSGSTITLYVNGLNEGTVTLSGAINNIAYPLYIGALNNQGALVSPFVGYISNARILNGTALYTSNFTPPTSPLTAITNTSLLTCHANRFVDGSSNNFTITRNGDTRVERFSPFAPSAAYSSSVIGGSAYFDGTGDFLTVPNNAAFQFGTDNFTVEGWVYFSSNAATEQHVFGKRASTVVYDPILCGVKKSGSNYRIYYIGSFNGSTWGLNSSFASGTIDIPINTWVHLAYVRNGSTFTGYVNGVADLTFTGLSSALMTNTDNQVVGAGSTAGDNPVTGYISNLRVLKGTALYTSNFTPPTAPLTAVTNTSLLVNAVNGGIVDATAGNVLETVGNAQVSTVQKKYGTGALYFDGTGDWLLLPHNANQLFGTGNFTVEMWLYLSVTGSTRGLAGKGTATTGWLVSTNTSNQVVFTFGSSTITSTGTVSGSTWTHIAVVREGTGSNQTKIYIGGTNDGTGTVSTDFNQTNSAYVGANRTGGDALNGYIDDLRITKGVARYTANFTPPIAALPLL